MLISEDNRVLLEALTIMLNGEADMRVVATIGSGNNVLLKAGKTKPEVILMDVGLKSLKEAKKPGATFTKCSGILFQQSWCR
jgi:DNA-binding NarL/FixJ family response regulator